jgi:hypothetical protein
VTLIIVTTKAQRHKEKLDTDFTDLHRFFLATEHTEDTEGKIKEVEPRIFTDYKWPQKAPAYAEASRFFYHHRELRGTQRFWTG